MFGITQCVYVVEFIVVVFDYFDLNELLTYLKWLDSNENENKNKISFVFVFVTNL